MYIRAFAPSEICTIKFTKKQKKKNTLRNLYDQIYQKKKKGKILHLKVIFGCTIGPKIRFLLENKVAGMAIHLVQHVECLAKV